MFLICCMVIKHWRPGTAGALFRALATLVLPTDPGSVLRVQFRTTTVPNLSGEKSWMGHSESQMTDFIIRYSVSGISHKTLNIIFDANPKVPKTLPT